MVIEKMSSELRKDKDCFDHMRCVKYKRNSDRLHRFGQMESENESNWVG